MFGKSLKVKESAKRSIFVLGFYIQFVAKVDIYHRQTIKTLWEIVA